VCVCALTAMDLLVGRTADSASAAARNRESPLDVLSRAALMLECSASTSPPPLPQPGNAIHYHSSCQSWLASCCSRRTHVMTPYLASRRLVPCSCCSCCCCQLISRLNPDLCRRFMRPELFLDSRQGRMIPSRYSCSRQDFDSLTL